MIRVLVCGNCKRPVLLPIPIVNPKPAVVYAICDHCGANVKAAK